MTTSTPAPTPAGELPDEPPTGAPRPDGPLGQAATSAPLVLSRRRLLGASVAAGLGTFVGTPALAAPSAPTPMHQPSADTMQRLALRSFRKIRGVPVYYGLNTDPVTWYCTPAFYDRLKWWMDTLKNWSSQNGYGDVGSIGSAGFYVDKPGQHGAGTAMDLSIVRWVGGNKSIPFNGHHAAASRKLRRRYFAVECTLRKRFRYVLDGNYNAAHRNHFHVDLGGLPNRRLLHGSRSDTVFIQAVCNNFLGSGLAIDGAWGPNTQTEVNKLKNRLNVVGDLQSDRPAVLKLLRGVANAGFKNQSI